MPPNRTLTDRTLGAALWVAFGSVQQILARLAIIAILARLLLPEHFGAVAAALVFINFGQKLGPQTIAMALVQLPGMTDRHFGAALQLSIALALSMFTAAVVSAGVLETLIGIQGTADIIRALACLFFLAALQEPSSRLLQRNLNFKTLTLAEFFAHVAGFGLVGIILAYQGLGVWSLVAAYIAQQSLLAATLLYLTRRNIAFRATWRAVREVGHLGLGMTATSWLAFIGQGAAQFFIGRFLGASSLGVYTRAIGVVDRGSGLLGYVVERVALPAFAKVQTEPESIRRAYLGGSSVVSVAAVPTIVVLALLSEEVVLILLGPNWSAAALPLAYLSPLLLLRATHHMAAGVLNGTGRVYQVAFSYAVNAAVVALALFPAVDHGLPGVCLAVLLGALCGNCVAIHFASRVAHVSFLRIMAATVRGAPLALVAGCAVLVGKVVLPAPEFGIVARLALVIALLGLAVGLFVWMFPNAAVGRDGMALIERIRSRWKPVEGLGTREG